MAEIKTKINVGDTVWWVKYTSGIRSRVIKGVVKGIHLCEGQGALYCEIHSPSNRINTHPVVHYHDVFLSIDEAREFAAYAKENPDDVVPMCMGCHYNAMKGVNDDD